MKYIMQLYDYDFCKESSQKHCKVGVEIQGKAEQGSQKIYRCEPDSCVAYYILDLDHFF